MRFAPEAGLMRVSWDSLFGNLFRGCPSPSGRGWREAPGEGRKCTLIRPFRPPSPRGRRTRASISANLDTSDVKGERTQRRVRSVSNSNTILKHSVGLTTPSAPASVAPHHFFDGAATPPVSGGGICLPSSATRSPSASSLRRSARVVCHRACM